MHAQLFIASGKFVALEGSHFMGQLLDERIHDLPKLSLCYPRDLAVS